MALVAPALARVPLSAPAHPAAGSTKRLRAALSGHWQPLTFVLLATWLVTVGLHHESWFDEAQAWLLARDSTPWQLLADRVRYEGSPGLWHMVLWGLSHAGLPYRHLSLASTGFALAGAAIVLWRAPFPPALRVLTVTSYFFAFQFPIVARSYALDLVLLPALAALFAGRARHPLAYGALIGLLANTNAHSFILAAVLGAEFPLHLARSGRWREPRALAGLALAATLGLLALAVAWQPPDNGFVTVEPGSQRWPLTVNFIREALVDRDDLWSGAFPTGLDSVAGALVSLLLLFPASVLFLRAGRLPLALGLFGALVCFSTATYANAWHAGTLTLAWLFCLWISWDALPRLGAEARKLVLGTTAAVLAIQTAQAAHAGLTDLAKPYSGAAAAARAIAAERERQPGLTVAAFGYKAFSVQPYFGANVFANYNAGAAAPAYIDWRTRQPWKTAVKKPAWRRLVASGYGALLLDTSRLSDLGKRRYRAIAAAAGYCAGPEFAGSMVWKGYIREDETLVFFTRCPLPPVAPVAPPAPSSR